MKAKFLQALLVLLLSVPIVAAAATDSETPRQALVLKFADATEETFFLADQPEVTFDGGKLKVMASGVETDFDQASVTEFYFDYRTTPTSVTSATAGKSTFSYTDNTTVSVTGSKGSVATLYTVGGKQLLRKSVEGGSVTVSLAGYAPGIYLLNIENDNTYKIIKK